MDKKSIDGLIRQLDGVIGALERQVIFGRTEGETLALDKLKDARLLLLGETPEALERRNRPTTRRTPRKDN